MPSAIDKKNDGRPPRPAQPPRQNARQLAQNIFLLILALAAAAALGEIMLRLFCPKYKPAAETALSAADDRLWAPEPMTGTVSFHPDTGARHLVLRNALGLRQHRDFSPADLDGAFNVALFGDSFAENSRLPAQYSLSEPLDYLLNRFSGRANVLNFGVDGYGTDQQYIYYSSLPADLKKRLKRVYYVLCGNDLRNIYENRLFLIGRDGRLRRRGERESNAMLRTVSGLHLTYLLRDSFNRLSGRAGEEDRFLAPAAAAAEERRRLREERFHSPEAEAIEAAFYAGRAGDIRETWEIFAAILRAWRAEVEANNGTFALVLLPREKEGSLEPQIPEGISVTNLYRLVGRDFTGFSFRRIKMEKDGHWNEEGNLLAAYYLFRDLELDSGRPTAPASEVKGAVLDYVMSFGEFRHVPAEWRAPRVMALDAAAAVRSKYLALEAGLPRK